MPNIVEEKILELIAVHNFPMRPAPGSAGGSIFGSAGRAIFGSAGRTIFGSAGRAANLLRSKQVRQQITTGASRLDSSEFNARKEKHKKTKKNFQIFLAFDVLVCYSIHATKI